MNRVRKQTGWEHLLEIASREGLPERAFTWNPAVGCSNADCEVRRRGKCWAMMMAKRFGWSFEPHLIPERLDEPLRERYSAVITPVSMGEMFDLQPNDVIKILDVCAEAHWHVFAFLTKKPQEAVKYNFSRISQCWFGVTVNSQNDVWRLNYLESIEGVKKYVLFEPLYGPIEYHGLQFLDLIVIGPQNYPLVQPKREWVESITKHVDIDHVFFKSKLKPID
jgi:protein gp37